MIWASYAFFIGRLGGKAFEDRPWAGLLLALGLTLVISVLIEAARRAWAWRRRRQDRARRPADPAARPHDLHTGCAGPAPLPGLLEASTRQVATEDERQDAAPAADATARPAVTAVAK